MSADPTNERQEYAQAAEASVPVSEIEALVESWEADALSLPDDVHGQIARTTIRQDARMLRALVARARGEQA